MQNKAKNNNVHMNIINNSEKFIASLETLFYADSNEKAVLRTKLEKILAGQCFKHALDLGAGPGHVAPVLEQHAEKLSLTPEPEHTPTTRPK